MDPHFDTVLHVGACSFCSALVAFATSRGDEVAFGASCRLVAAHVHNTREQRAWSKRVRETFVQRAGEQDGGRPMEKTVTLPEDLFQELCDEAELHAAARPASALGPYRAEAARAARAVVAAGGFVDEREDRNACAGAWSALGWRGEGGDAGGGPGKGEVEELARGGRARLLSRETTMQRFHVACSRCGLVLFFVDRIGDDELRSLWRHLRAAHPAAAVPDDAPAGQVLQHFSVHEVRA